MTAVIQHTNVYIDGFNVYYRALKSGPFKWLNYKSLVEQMLNKTNKITNIKYFTARVTGRSDPDEPRRQQAYLNALSTLPEVEIFHGSFLDKTITRPLRDHPQQYVDVLTSEEKGSDVNLATRLVFDACRGAFDVAVVLSKDTDLIEPIRIVKEEFGKVVGIICPDDNLPEGLRNVASFAKHIRKAHLDKAQFPNKIPIAGGTIDKPTEWF